MTVQTFYELSCDAPGCDVAYEPEATEVTSLRGMLAGARRAGWSAGKRRGLRIDLCPAHTAPKIQ